MAAELDARIATLFAEEGLPLKRARLAVTTERVADAAALRARLAGVAGDGWVCATSETPSRWGAALPASPVLSAEVALADGTSVHVRYSGDAWLVTTIREVAGDGADGEDCVGYEVACLSSLGGAAGQTMKYDVWWRREATDGVAVWRPWLARFVGHGRT